MSRSAMGILAGVACLTAVACFREPVPPYRGRVEDASSGRPVKGAAVIHKIDFSCPQLNMTDGRDRKVPGPLLEARTNREGVFVLSPHAKIPRGCRLRSRTMVLATGYFPIYSPGNPSLVKMRPMIHYLDYLPWRYPREYLPDPRRFPDTRQRRFCHRVIGEYQMAHGFASLELQSSFLSGLRADLESRPLIPSGEPGVFWKRPGAVFDRIKRLPRGEGFLLHCARSQSWYRISKHGYPDKSPPSLPRGATILPGTLPADRGFVFVRSGRIHIPRNPAASAAPFTMDRYISFPCSHPDVTAVEPWGSGAVSIEGSGRYIIFYRRAKGSLKIMREITPPKPLNNSGKSTFAGLLTTPDHVLALVRHGDRVDIHTLPAPWTGMEPPPPMQLQSTPMFTAAAWQNGLVLGFADGGLRRWTTRSRRISGEGRRDRIFETFTDGMLPGPPIGVATGLDHHILAVCGGEEVYRFGILGIPDQIVRLGKDTGGSGDSGRSPGELKTSPPRIHPQAGRAKTHAEKKEKPRTGP